MTMMNNSSSTVTLYTISASYLDGSTRVACNTAEVLGDSFGAYYADRADAEKCRDDLQDTLGESGLDASTEYRVDEVKVRITDVSCERDRLSGGVTVYADISLDGETYATAWSARDSVSSSGNEGLEPAGDSFDCWVDGAIADFGVDVALKIGQEVLAVASAL